MKRLLIAASLGLATLCTALAVTSRDGGTAGRVLSHDVYFTLRESTPETRQALVEACRQYLSGHEGTVSFAAGTRAPEMKREVNDTAFDVSLHIAFESEEAHATYQEHPRHREFIAAMGSNWETVRVFDSWVTLVP